MSRSVDLFIDADLTLDEMADALGSQTGSALFADGDTRRVLQEGPLRAVLSEHPYGDDGELLFTRYRFALSARVAGESRPQDSPEAGLLRRVAEKVHQDRSWPVLIVLDLQYRDGPDPAESPRTSGEAASTDAGDRADPSTAGGGAR